MAVRGTQQEVLDIMDTTWTVTQIWPFILAANVIVTDKLGSNTDITNAHKKEIERWLAAHFASAGKDVGAMEEEVGDTRIRYFGKDGKGLELTRYGQMVMQLDTTGTLQGLGKRKASFATIDAPDVDDDDD